MTNEVDIELIINILSHLKEIIVLQKRKIAQAQIKTKISHSCTFIFS